MKLDLHMGVAEACLLRWQRGIENYRCGNERLAFRGDSLREAYEEALDQVNYLDQVGREARLGRELLAELRAKVVGVAETLRFCLLSEEMERSR